MKKRFNNHTIFLKASFGYFILVVKKDSFVDVETAESIIASSSFYIKEGFSRISIHIDKTVRSSFDAVDHVLMKYDHNKIERVAIFDESLGPFQRLIINSFVKLLYLKGQIEIKTFKTRKEAGKWLKE